MDEQTARMIQQLKSNPAMLQALMQSRDGQALMQMLSGGDRGASLQRAAQSAANLAACGVIPSVDTDPQALSAPLTRGEAAELLDGALVVLAEQDSGSWLPW